VEVPLTIVGQAHTLLERQLAELTAVIARLEQSPATKPEAARVLDIWHQIASVEEILRALHRGALIDSV